MPGYFFKYVAPKIAKNLTQRRKVKDEAFKSIDEKGKGLSLQKRSNIKKSFSGKASKIFDDASKARKGKMNGGTMDEKNRKEIQKQKVKLGLGVFDEKGNFQAKKRKKMMGGGMMGRRFGLKKGTNLGMQSVKYGLDNNPKITAADPKAKFIAANKKKKSKSPMDKQVRKA